MDRKGTTPEGQSPVTPANKPQQIAPVPIFHIPLDFFFLMNIKAKVSEQPVRVIGRPGGEILNPEFLSSWTDPLDTRGLEIQSDVRDRRRSGRRPSALRFSIRSDRVDKSEPTALRGLFPSDLVRRSSLRDSFRAEMLVSVSLPKRRAPSTPSLGLVPGACGCAAG